MSHPSVTAAAFALINRNATGMGRADVCANRVRLSRKDRIGAGRRRSRPAGCVHRDFDWNKDERCWILGIIRADAFSNARRICAIALNAPFLCETSLRKGCFRFRRSFKSIPSRPDLLKAYGSFVDQFESKHNQGVSYSRPRKSLPYLMERSSISKIRVTLGPIWLPAPRSP